MNEDQVRSVARDVIRRRLAVQVPSLQPPIPVLGPAFESHASHARFMVVRGGDGPCLIEPVVACTHCGFCQSHGY